METEDSNRLSVPADALRPHDDDAVVSISDDADDNDDDDDDDIDAESAGSSDRDVIPIDENLNDDNDSRASSADVYESRTPFLHPADVTIAAAATAAPAVALDGPSSTVPAETGIERAHVSVTGDTVTQLTLRASDLDDSLSCFKTTKRKKPILPSPPVSKDDDADDAEVIYLSGQPGA